MHSFPSFSKAIWQSKIDGNYRCWLKSALVLFVYQVYPLSEGAFGNCFRIHLGLPNITWGVKWFWTTKKHQIDSNVWLDKIFWYMSVCLLSVAFLKTQCTNSREHLWPTHPSLHYTRWNPPPQKKFTLLRPSPAKKKENKKQFRAAYLFVAKVLLSFQLYFEDFCKSHPATYSFRGCVLILGSLPEFVCVFSGPWTCVEWFSWVAKAMGNFQIDFDMHIQIEQCQKPWFT